MVDMKRLLIVLALVILVMGCQPGGGKSTVLDAVIPTFTSSVAPTTVSFPLDSYNQSLGGVTVDYAVVPSTDVPVNYVGVPAVALDQQTNNLTVMWGSEAINYTVDVSWTSGSPTVTLNSGTLTNSPLTIGSVVISSPPGIPSGATITAMTSTTITLSSNATTTGSAGGIVFFTGNYTTPNTVTPTTVEGNSVYIGVSSLVFDWAVKSGYFSQVTETSF
jgi:hypothetical protein